MSVTRFLAGFAVGASLGALAGILLAPQSGEETREAIGSMAKDVARKTDETVKDIQEKADTIVSDMQEKGDEIISKIQDLINKQKKEEVME
ncbi:MAG: YtxH domain-containing protein [Candidatus Gastranaerophilaceae bacterium]